MILMDEMVPLRLYSSKLRAYIPFNPANKKKGAMITLLTNGVDDSIQLINMPYIHNPLLHLLLSEPKCQVLPDEKWECDN